jgi:hypothetical protein
METQLVRLQIPNNWTVSDNKFYDVDPIYDKDGHITNWHEGFSEDVLWIQQSFFKDGVYQSPTTHCFDVDISFRSRQYVATLKYTNNKSSYEIDRLESADRNQIRVKIEFWLTDISSDISNYKDRFKKQYPDEVETAST